MIKRPLRFLTNHVKQKKIDFGISYDTPKSFLRHLENANRVLATINLAEGWIFTYRLGVV